MKKYGILLIACLVCAVGLFCPSARAAGESAAGDANADGRVTAADARLVLRASVGLEAPDLPRMDADADGRVTAADARLVLRFAVGLESVLPVPGNPAQTEPRTDAKTLVVYFSRTGNTKALAESAARALDAELYEIRAKIPYTDEDIRYDTGCRAYREQRDPAARPEIADPLPELSGYGTVLLGYPIWHGQAPKLLYTFLESVDLTGKTVAPFCTSASSPVGTSAVNLHPLAPRAEWKEGKRFAAGTTEEELLRWLTDAGLINGERKEEPALRMTIDGTEIRVDWENNESVAALAALAERAPVTVRASAYGGFEQVGALGADLPHNDARITTAPGDLVLYNGNQIVLFYGSNTWRYTRLGTVGGPDQAALPALLGKDGVTLAFSAE